MGCVMCRIFVTLLRITLRYHEKDYSLFAVRSAGGFHGNGAKRVIYVEFARHGQPHPIAPKGGNHIEIYSVRQGFDLAAGDRITFMRSKRDHGYSATDIVKHYVALRVVGIHASDTAIIK